MRKRKVIKIGQDYYIKLNSYDIKDLGIDEGEEIDVEGSLLTNFFKKFKKN